MLKENECLRFLFYHTFSNRLSFILAIYFDLANMNSRHVKNLMEGFSEKRKKAALG